MDTTRHYVEDSTFVLPVELSSFVSTVINNSVTLNWTTSIETNSQRFDIERKMTIGAEWTKVGSVEASGTTNETHRYSFTEKVNTGRYNYRLKQIDFNGASEYFLLTNEVHIGVPVKYALSQNYPNPFNPNTKIDFNMPYDGRVVISLHDLSGREVGNIIDEEKTAGYYTVQFNASDLASGMYFYRITASGKDQEYVMLKKMMLVK